ncbi:MAG TPA: hypothetical protein VJL37_07830, partial [Flavobacterium sp.]|nr:hypothetical protein [Flavobacterium sp.]
MKRKNAFLLFIIVLLSPIEIFSQSDVFEVARTGTVDQMKTLSASNPDVVNALNDEGNSPLIIACYKG